MLFGCLSKTDSGIHSGYTTSFYLKSWIFWHNNHSNEVSINLIHIYIPQLVQKWNYESIDEGFCFLEKKPPTLSSV